MRTRQRTRRSARQSTKWTAVTAATTERAGQRKVRCWLSAPILRSAKVIAGPRSISFKDRGARRARHGRARAGSFQSTMWKDRTGSRAWNLDGRGGSRAISALARKQRFCRFRIRNKLGSASERLFAVQIIFLAVCGISRLICFVLDGRPEGQWTGRLRMIEPRRVEEIEVGP
jgi:hypothetical protein